MNNGGLVVDLFAGGGGASTGLERAGLEVDIAINHDPRAIALHMAAHPYTRHYHCDVWEVDPAEATQGLPVDVLWGSPDCTFFSKARGGAPFRDRNTANRRRALATVLLRWARICRPRVILMENVAEFVKWGPLDSDGLPDKAREGSKFARWAAHLKRLGYTVEWRNLCAADYGAPTSRTRLFLVARRDGRPIVWPAPTHGPEGSQPHRVAAEIIDWSIPAPSIFDRPKLPAINTCKRIARGVVEKVIADPNPYIVDRAHTLIARGFGERKGQAPRVPGLDVPLGTICAGGNKHMLVTAYMARNWGGMVGNRLDDRPWPTLTTKPHQDKIVELTLAERMAKPFAREGEVRAFLDKYYGTGVASSVKKPCPTLTTKARLGLVTVAGVDRQIVDIGMRMLTVPELFAAQGFPADYPLDVRMSEHKSLSSAAVGKKLGSTDLTFLCGNSVCPDVATALAAANAREAGGAAFTD